MLFFFFKRGQAIQESKLQLESSSMEQNNESSSDDGGYAEDEPIAPLKTDGKRVRGSLNPEEIEGMNNEQLQVSS